MWYVEYIECVENCTLLLTVLYGCEWLCDTHHSLVRSFNTLYDFDGADEIRLKLRLPTEEVNE